MIYIYKLIIVGFCFLFIELDAQKLIFSPFPKDVSKMTTVDSGNIRILYALNAVDISKIATYADLQCLEIGDHLSKYYSRFIYKSDSLCTDWKKKHPHAQNSPTMMGELSDFYKSGTWSEYQWSEYFKDFSKNTFIEYARMPRGISDYFSSENIYVQDWIFFDDTLSVLGYLCQKAICRFRGRDYIAWFAPQIPISNGPWKFGGLPGLILKVYDTAHNYIFECIEIKHHKDKYYIRQYDDYNNYSKLEQKKLLKLQKDIHEDYPKISGWIITNRDGTPAIFEKVTYYPIELE
jgi:GLPGLI family protein